MYEARQNKEKVSRTLSIENHANVRPLKMGNDKQHSIFTKRNIVQCSPWDILSGISSIVGGGISMITGGRDTYNAIYDYSHNTYTIKNQNSILITNATGTLEEIPNNTDNKVYKVKVEGNINNINDIIINNNVDNKMPGATARIAEGILNTSSGILNLIAGATSMAGNIAPSIMYGIGTLSSGGAALLRYLRSRSSQKQEASSGSNTTQTP